MEHQDDDVIAPADLRLADEIARFVAERAFEFKDVEARAWALSDFSVWCRLAGEAPCLGFETDLAAGTGGSKGDQKPLT